MIGGKLAYLFEFFIFINVLFYELPNLLDLYISQSSMTTLPIKRTTKHTDLERWIENVEEKCKTSSNSVILHSVKVFALEIDICQMNICLSTWYIAQYALDLN